MVVPRSSALLPQPFFPPSLPFSLCSVFILGGGGVVASDNLCWVLHSLHDRYGISETLFPPRHVKPHNNPISRKM